VGLHGVIAAAPTRNLLLALFSTRQRIARPLLVALFEHILSYYIHNDKRSDCCFHRQVCVGELSITRGSIAHPL
jgi:hypothetical protein